MIHAFHETNSSMPASMSGTILIRALLLVRALLLIHTLLHVSAILVVASLMASCFSAFIFSQHGIKFSIANVSGFFI
jgi:hypothetical protein